MNQNHTKKRTAGLLLGCLFMLLFSGSAYGQARQITGTVTDAGGPMPGVAVTVKGAYTGAVTDGQGRYIIQAATDQTLVFSFMGFITQEIVVKTQNVINVTMVEDVTGLEEVVVIGYGTVRRRDLTGAVSSVKSEDIVLRPGPNPVEALQGKVAGLDITRPSGATGSEVKIQLRGNRSFTASGTPLFLIDGLPGNYETLNANDIESVEVLKDASSTAIYGSAGSNGVVIITTKSGKTGKVSVDFNAYVGFNGWSTTPEMRHGEDYLQAKRDAYRYVWDASARQWTTTGAIWQSPADDETIFGTERWKLYQEGIWMDWADTFLQKSAATQNYSLSVSGGNEKTKGYLSFNYTDENGQYKGDEYKLYSTSMRIDHNVKPWLTIGSSLQGSYAINDNAQDKLENALVTDPLIRAYNEDGSLNTNLGNNVYNLLLNYQPGVYVNRRNNLRVNVNPYIEIKPLKGMTFTSRAGIWMNYNNTYNFDGIGSVAYTYSNAGIAKAKIQQNRNYGYQWDNVLTYNFTVKDDHDFTVTGVSTWKHDQNQKTTMDQSGITSNNFKWHNMQGDTNTSATSSYTMSKTLGLIGRLNYSYLGKYLLAASVRYDGSSVLYRDNQWDTFPAVSVGWRISEESFMQQTQSWLNSLKIRVGWGVTGSANIDPYSSVNNLETIDTSLGGLTQSTYRNSQYITNANLGWEKSYNTNIGLDATLLDNRIDLSLDYYMTTTKGVIWSVNLPVIYGAYTPGTNYQTYMNLCETKNRGFEVTLNTRNIIDRDFEWTSALTFATNKEEIVKLVEGAAKYITNGNYTLTVGEAIQSFYNHKLNGVWQIGQEKDAAVFNKRPGDMNVSVPNMERLGEGVYVKTADDGTKTYHYTNLEEAKKYDSSLTAASSTYAYSNNDYQILGHNTPNWTLGFQNSFRYKSFDLGVYAFMRFGQMISYCMTGWYQPNAFATNASPSRTFNKNFNYWTPTNPSNDFPVMNYQESSSTQTGLAGRSFIDGSFFKLKNVTLGYTLPNKISRKMAIEKLRVYGTMTNLLVIAKDDLLKNYDPEMNGSMDYPLTRQIVFGLNVTF